MGSGSILFVEADEDTARAFAKLLTIHGYVVYTAGSAAVARKLADEHAFDLLIADLGLPDGDGCELFTGLRQKQPIIGIAVTGYGAPADFARTKAAGFMAHLLKPVKIDALLETVKKALQG